MLIDVEALASLMLPDHRFVDVWAFRPRRRFHVGQAGAVISRCFPDYWIQSTNRISEGDTVLAVDVPRTIDRIAWQTPAAWLAVILGVLMSECGCTRYKPVYEICQKGAEKSEDGPCRERLGRQKSSSLSGPGIAHTRGSVSAHCVPSRARKQAVSASTEDGEVSGKFSSHWHPVRAVHHDALRLALAALQLEPELLLEHSLPQLNEGMRVPPSFHISEIVDCRKPGPIEHRNRPPLAIEGREGSSVAAGSSVGSKSG